MTPDREEAREVPENPWGATEWRTLRLYQIGCWLVALNVLAWVAFVITFVWGQS